MIAKNIAATMTMLMLMFCLAWTASAQETPATQPAATETLRLPSFGLSVVVSPGWIRNGEDDYQTAAQWTKLNAAGTAALGILRIEISFKKTAPTLADFAQQAATTFGGKLNDRPATLGGQPALEIDGNAPPDKGRVYLAEALVAEHAGHYYTVFYFAPTDDAGSRDALTALASGLQWCDLASPADAIAPRQADWPDLIPLPGSNMMFAVPDPFRFVGDSGGQTQYMAFNFADDKPGATLTIGAGEAKGDSVAAIEASLSQKGTQMGLVAPLTWTTIGPSVALSAPVSRTADADGVARGPIQLILVMADSGKCVRMLLIDPPGEAPDKYVAAAQQIARSIQKAP